MKPQNLLVLPLSLIIPQILYYSYCSKLALILPFAKEKQIVVDTWYRFKNNLIYLTK